MAGKINRVRLLNRNCLEVGDLVEFQVTKRSDLIRLAGKFI